MYQEVLMDEGLTIKCIPLVMAWRMPCRLILNTQQIRRRYTPPRQKSGAPVGVNGT